jgi:very-short-patch-repair endonuclease
MDKQWIVTGSHTDEKRALAYRLRREMTRHEKRLWQQLKAGRLGGLHFRRQQIIDGFIADCYCHAARLVMELDGAVHSERADYDAERDRIIATRDLLVLRFTNDAVEQNLNSVLIQIMSAARQRL